jgi:hypothetical protein
MRSVDDWDEMRPFDVSDEVLKVQLYRLSRQPTHQRFVKKVNQQRAESCGVVVVAQQPAANDESMRRWTALTWVF